MNKSFFITLLVIVNLNADDCQTLQDFTGQTRSGFIFQGTSASMSFCENWFITDGDGTGLYFENPNPDSNFCPSGYCFFNKPDVVTPPDDPVRPDPVIGSGSTVEDLIPFVDNIEYNQDSILLELEDINSETQKTNDNLLNIKSKVAITNLELSNINSKLNTTNTNLDSINTNSNTTNTKLDDLNTKAGQSNTHLQSLSNRATQEQLEDNDLTDLANNTNTDNSTELDGLTTQFTSDYQSTLSSNFGSYAPSFGFGGYGTAPAPISFTLLEQTYEVFNISYLSAYITHIRSIFVITAYIFGLFIVFRSN